MRHICCLLIEHACCLCRYGNCHAAAVLCELRHHWAESLHLKLADVACGKDMTERQDAEDSARMVMGEGLEGGGVAQQMVSEWISKQRERERDDGSNAEPLRFDVLVEVLSALRVVCPGLGWPHDSLEAQQNSHIHSTDFVSL